MASQNRRTAQNGNQGNQGNPGSQIPRELKGITDFEPMNNFGAIMQYIDFYDDKELVGLEDAMRYHLVRSGKVKIGVRPSKPHKGIKPSAPFQVCFKGENMNPLKYNKKAWKKFTMEQQESVLLTRKQKQQQARPLDEHMHDNTDSEEEPIKENLPCGKCRKGADDPHLWVCDGCNQPFHPTCVGETANNIPSGKWFCINCRINPPNNKAIVGIMALKTKDMLLATRQNIIAHLNDMHNKLKDDIFRANERIQHLETQLRGMNMPARQRGRRVQAMPLADLRLERAQPRQDNGEDDPGAANDEDGDGDGNSVAEETECRRCRFCRDNKTGTFLCLNLMRGKVGKANNKDPRTVSAKNMHNVYLFPNMVCDKKQCMISAHCNLLDYRHRPNYCVYCRVKRRKTNMVVCSNCEPHEKPCQINHANNKMLIYTALSVLRETMPIRSIEIMEEKDPRRDAENRGKPNVDAGNESGPVDSLVIVTDEQDRKFLFVIELQNSKDEYVPTLTHKFGQFCLNEDPFRAFLICFRLMGPHSVVTKFAHRVDMLRRWIIFAVRYGEHLPVYNHWWMFWEGQDNPLQNTTYPLSPFMSQAVIRIQGPPKGILSDWEFASDIYAGHMKVKKAAEHPFAYVMGDESAEVDVKELFGSQFPEMYSPLDVSTMPNLYNAMRCRPGCETCRKLFGGSSAPSF